VTADEYTFIEGDDGSLSAIDPDGFNDEVNTILALLFDGGLTGETDHLAAERLQELWDATSPAYVRKVALTVMSDAGQMLLMGHPFLLFPVLFNRLQFFVMTYRRLRPDWEERQFMGGGDD
jgi:hypothetical protein